MIIGAVGCLGCGGPVGERTNEAATNLGLEVDGALEAFGPEQSGIIPALQAVQARVGYLPPVAFARVARRFNIPESRVWGVATFYAQFHLERQGRHKVKVCRGTACHVKGSAAVLEALERELSIKAGETTRDGEFSVEVVACIGACGLAPVIAVNGEFHAGVTTDSIKEIIEAYRGKATEDDAN